MGFLGHIDHSNNLNAELLVVFIVQWFEAGAKRDYLHVLNGCYQPCQRPFLLVSYAYDSLEQNNTFSHLNGL